MGFRSFQGNNLSYLGKQAWRVLKKPETLWAKTFKAIYFPNQDFRHASKGSAPSWIWTNLLQGQDFIMRNGNWAIGNGEQIRVWKDKWLWSGEYLNHIDTSVNLLVRDLLDPTSGSWALQKLHRVFPPEVVSKAFQTSIQIT